MTQPLNPIDRKAAPPDPDPVDVMLADLSDMGPVRLSLMLVGAICLYLGFHLVSGTRRVVRFCLGGSALAGDPYDLPEAPELLYGTSVLPRPAVFTNHKMRRAQTACLRRFERHIRKYGRPLYSQSAYMPDYYNLFSFMAARRQDMTLSFGRFLERYVRETGSSRVEVYGLTGHEPSEGDSVLPPAISIFPAKTDISIGLRHLAPP